MLTQQFLAMCTFLRVVTRNCYFLKYYVRGEIMVIQSVHKLCDVGDHCVILM
jgi:hypothetical protein